MPNPLFSYEQLSTSWTPNKSISSAPLSRTCPSARKSSGGIFDYDAKAERVRTVNASLEDPAVWNDPKRAQELGREKKALDDVVVTLDELTRELADNSELYDMSKEDGDEAGLVTIRDESAQLQAKIEQLEFRRMFNQPADPSNAFLDIQAGAGGTEAQDWASMLLRQYLRYAERKGFKSQVEDESPGETAGIKGATIKIEGEYAFGLLRTETGVHRLVRKSPFDSAGGRHTSFASVFVYPEIDDSIEIDINPSDVRTDTYRASGAGGQHITRPIRRCASRTFRPASSCSARTAAASTATAMSRGSGCAHGSMTMRCASARKSSKSSKTARPTLAGAIRSAATCSTRAASRTCAPTSKSRTPRKCWTATSMHSSKRR